MSTYRTTVDDVTCTLEIEWVAEGRYFAAGPQSPAELPVPVVQFCRLRCGDYLSPRFGFDQLSDELQEIVLSELQDEICEQRECALEEEADIY